MNSTVMNQVKTGAVLNYVIIGLNTFVGLLYTPYMLRCLGQNEYGLYSLAASVIAYLTLLDFGFGNAIVRYTAKFRAEKKTMEQWEMFGMFLVVYFLIGLLAFLGGLMLCLNADALFDRTMLPNEIALARTMMILLTANLAVTFPLSMFGSIITAYENFVFQKVVSIARILLSTAVLLLVLYLGYKAVALVVVQTVFNLFTLMLNFFYCKYRLRIRIVFGRFNLPFITEISLYSFWLFLNVIIDRIYWSTGQFVLGATVGTVAVAVFSVAILFQQMYMSFSTAICGVLLPKITAMVTTGKSDKEISDIFIRIGRLQCIVMAFILSGFIVFGKSFISLWAGEGYNESYLITLLFFGALFIPLIQNTGITILQARNCMKFRSLLYICVSSVSLIFQIWLSKVFGSMGCAIAIAGALLLGQGLIMNVYYKIEQQIDIGHFWKEIGKMCITPILVTALAISGIRCFALDSYMHLSVTMLVFTIGYSTVFWHFGMNRYERQLITGSFREIFRKQATDLNGHT